MNVKNQQKSINSARKLALRLGLFIVLASSILACKKYSFEETSETSFLEVAEQNKSAIFFYSETDDSLSGAQGFPQFQSYLDEYDETEALACLTWGAIPGGDNDTIFAANAWSIGLVGGPAFRANLTLPDVPGSINLHKGAEVVANAACELTVDASTITITTTTEFFQTVSGDYYLTPYIVVDSILAVQNGHPDTPNTYHRKVITDVGRIPGFNAGYMGYKIAGGTVDAGQRVNLTFVANRHASWVNPAHISVLLLITKKSGSSIEFVNANTNN